MTNSKSSFKLTAFCESAVSTQDVFWCEWIWVVRRQISTILALSSEGFGSLLAFFNWVFGFFQQFSWPFLAFFYWRFGFFWKNKSGNPGDQGSHWVFFHPDLFFSRPVCLGYYGKSRDICVFWSDNSSATSMCSII